MGGDGSVVGEECQLNAEPRVHTVDSLRFFLFQLELAAEIRFWKHWCYYRLKAGSWEGVTSIIASIVRQLILAICELGIDIASKKIITFHLFCVNTDACKQAYMWQGNASESLKTLIFGYLSFETRLNVDTSMIVIEGDVKEFWFHFCLNPCSTVKFSILPPLFYSQGENTSLHKCKWCIESGMRLCTRVWAFIFRYEVCYALVSCLPCKNGNFSINLNFVFLTSFISFQNWQMFLQFAV